jgi:hypothetical protein
MSAATLEGGAHDAALLSDVETFCRRFIAYPEVVSVFKTRI